MRELEPWSKNYTDVYDRAGNKLLPHHVENISSYFISISLWQILYLSIFSFFLVPFTLVSDEKISRKEEGRVFTVLLHVI